ncbi:SURF1 family protein [Phenylobacterium sp.]|uniref:SURF1 family protein n=1 Tax=Phenylobacterium sp. TaxID=1871053 RepID=UPI00374C8BBA
MTDSWEPKLEPRAGPPAAAASEKGGFPVGLTVAAAIAFAILIGLGVWQLQRLKWKEALLAHVAKLEMASPQSLEYTLGELTRGHEVEFTRVSVVCPGLATAPYQEVYDLRDGTVGARLVSACPVDNDTYKTILVDRGFVPDVRPARPPVDAQDMTPIEVVGVLRKPERGNFTTPRGGPGHWYLHDVAGLSQALRVSNPAPVLLFAESRINPSVPAITPAPLPVQISNRHLGYALTWLGLAGALAGVYGAAVIKRMRG